MLGRCAAYAAAIAALPAEARAVGAAWNARPCVPEPIQSAAHVDELIRARRVQACPGEGRKNEGWDEYFNYAVELQTLQRFFDTACPPPARRTIYADLAFLSFLKNAVPTARFKPSSAGFADNWAYLYDKPVDERLVSTAQGNASSGVNPSDEDDATARRLRAMRGMRCLTDASDMALRLLAAQLRSVLEIYCQSFSGTPKPLNAQAFLMLGKLSLLDHMEVLGYGELARSDDKELNRLIAENLRSSAAVFGVSTVPPIVG